MNCKHNWVETMTGTHYYRYKCTRCGNQISALLNKGQQ